jgi:hypothetical protein
LPVRAANEAIRQWKSKPLSKQALIGVENRIGSSGKWAFGTELLSDGETCHSSPGAAFEQLNGKRRYLFSSATESRKFLLGNWRREYGSHFADTANPSWNFALDSHVVRCLANWPFNSNLSHMDQVA